MINKCGFCNGDKSRKYGDSHQLIFNFGNNIYRGKEFLVEAVIQLSYEEVNVGWVVDFKYCPYCGQRLEDKDDAK